MDATDRDVLERVELLNRRIGGALLHLLATDDPGHPMPPEEFARLAVAYDEMSVLLDKHAEQKKFEDGTPMVVDGLPVRPSQIRRPPILGEGPQVVRSNTPAEGQRDP